jgi:hypothetical protein
MNFVAQVEEHLRDLGTEARRKHPGESKSSWFDLLFATRHFVTWF